MVLKVWNRIIKMQLKKIEASNEMRMKITGHQSALGKWFKVFHHTFLRCLLYNKITK